jgi:hypothetical protein
MRYSRLILAAMTMLLLFASFLSVPALSGENPWDADNGGGGSTGVPIDSTKNAAAAASSFEPPGLAPGSPEGDSLDRFTGYLLRMSFYIMERFSDWTSSKAQVKTAY